MVRANLIYTLNGKTRYEEWSRIPATVTDNSTVTAQLPKGTTHYVINLIDENNFLVSYPEVPAGNQISKTKEKYSKYGIAAAGS